MSFAPLPQARERSVSAEALADWLGVNPRTVRRWMRRGLLPGVPLGDASPGHRSRAEVWRISYTQLRTWPNLLPARTVAQLTPTARQRLRLLRTRPDTAFHALKATEKGHEHSRRAR